MISFNITCFFNNLLINKVNEKCVKALIHKGRAFNRLKEFEQALEVLKQAKEISKNDSIDGKKKHSKMILKRKYKNTY